MSAPRDANRIPAIQGTSNAAGVTPVNIGADPVTKRVLVSGTITNPAGEELATYDNQSPLDKFGILYATEYGATYNYIAKYSATGAWIVQRETISTGIRDYAFQANQDPALSPDTVVTAWTGRATNDYGQYSE